MGQLTILERSLILSYLHIKLSVANLEIVLMEMPDNGMLQHRLEKLRGAANRAFEIVEKNIEGKDQLIADIEAKMDQEWGIFIEEEPNEEVVR